MSDTSPPDAPSIAMPAGEGEALYCTVHPDRGTSLRCNRCGRPMCVRCAVQTPVGYRCRECVRNQQDIYYTATPLDAVIAAAASAGVSLLANYVAGLLPPFLMLFLAAATGGTLPQLIGALTGRRRGRYTHFAVAAGIVIGAIPTLLPLAQVVLIGAPLAALLWPALFNAVLFAVAYGWFRRGPSI